MKFPSLSSIIQEDLVVRRRLYDLEAPRRWVDSHFYSRHGERGLFVDIPLYSLGMEMIYKIEAVDDYLQVTSSLKQSFLKRLFGGRGPVEIYHLDCRGFKPIDVLDKWMSNDYSYESRLIIYPTLGHAICAWPKCEYMELFHDSVRPAEWVLIPKFKGLEAIIESADEIPKAGRKLHAQTTEFGKVVWLQYLLWAYMYLYTQAFTDLHRLLLKQLLERELGLEVDIGKVDEIYHLSVGCGGLLQYAFRGTDPNHNSPNRVFGFIHISLYGTLVSERSIEQRFTKDFHELFTLLESSDGDIIPWHELAKDASGNTDLDLLVQVQPEYNLLKELK